MVWKLGSWVFFRTDALIILNQVVAALVLGLWLAPRTLKNLESNERQNWASVARKHLVRMKIPEPRVCCDYEILTCRLLRKTT